MMTSEIILLVAIALVVLLVAILWFAGLVGMVADEQTTTAGPEKQRDEARKERYGRVMRVAPFSCAKGAPFFPRR